MIKFNKALNLNIVTLTISILLLLTGIVYSYPLKDSLRVPVGKKSTYDLLIGAMHMAEREGELVDVPKAEKEMVEPEYLEGTFRIIDRIIPLHTNLGRLLENVIKKAYRSGNIRYYVNLDSVGSVQMSPEGAPKVGLAIELKKALRKTTQALGFDDEVIYDYLAFHLVRMGVQSRLDELLGNDVDRTRTKTGEEFVGFVAENLLAQQLSIDRLNRLARFEEFLERNTVVVSSGLNCSIGVRNHIKIKQNQELQKTFQHSYMPYAPEYYINSIFPTKAFDKEFNADWAIMACHSLGLVDVIAFHRDLLKALEGLPKDSPIKIADLGTGFGSCLVELGLWLKDHGFKVGNLLGVDKIAEKAPKWKELCDVYPQLSLRFELTEVENLKTDERFDIVAINAPYSNENFIEMLPKALELLSRGGYLWIRFTASQAQGASISGHAADGLIRLLDERFPNNWRAVTVDLPEDFLAGLVDFVPGAASSYPKGRLCLVYMPSSEQPIQGGIGKESVNGKRTPQLDIKERVETVPSSPSIIGNNLLLSDTASEVRLGIIKSLKKANESKVSVVKVIDLSLFVDADGRLNTRRFNECIQKLQAEGIDLKEIMQIILIDTDGTLRTDAEIYLEDLIDNKIITFMTVEELNDIREGRYKDVSSYLLEQRFKEKNIDITIAYRRDNESIFGSLEKKITYVAVDGNPDVASIMLGLFYNELPKTALLEDIDNRLRQERIIVTGV